MLSLQYFLRIWQLELALSVLEKIVGKLYIFVGVEFQLCSELCVEVGNSILDESSIHIVVTDRLQICVVAIVGSAKKD